MDSVSDTTAPVSLCSIALAYTVLDAVRLFATETFALKVAVPVSAKVLLPASAPVTVSVLLATTAELIVVPPTDFNSVVLLDTTNTLLASSTVKFIPLKLVLPETNKPVEFVRGCPPAS